MSGLTIPAVPVAWEDWPRYELYRFFQPMDNPIFGVTFTLDVTRLYAWSKARGVSFYYALVFLCTEAMNEVEAFHYCERNGQLWRLARRIPSFTDLKPGAEQFHIVTIDHGDDLDAFCRRARQESRTQTCFIRSEAESDALIYFSCLPWLPLTHLTNERNNDPTDAIPRLSWGRYTERDGRKTLSLSAELNHRYVDGLHLGRFYEGLCARIAALEVDEPCSI